MISAGFTLDQRGQFNWVKGEKWAQWALRTAILTVFNERRRYPRLGTRLHHYLHRALNQNAINELKDQLYDDLKKSVPEIEIETVDVLKAEQGFGNIQIELTYRVRGSQLISKTRMGING